MTFAIGRLSNTKKELGTVFAVSDRRALTAFHCVGDRTSGKVVSRRLICTWDVGQSRAVVEEFDVINDVAVLLLDRALPSGLEAISLSREVNEHARFIAPGAPADIEGVFTYAASGSITRVGARRTEDGASVIQLSSVDSVAGLSLHGLSGAPVLVGHPQKAVGIVRWNPRRVNEPTLAAGAAIFAAPAGVILDHWPKLDPITGVDQLDLKHILQGLVRRNKARSLAAISENLVKFLVGCEIGLAADDLSIRVDTKRQNCRIEIEQSASVIELSVDLRNEEDIKSGEWQLSRQLAARSRSSERRHIGLLTDGAIWYLYHRFDGRLRRVEDATLIVDPTTSTPEQLRSWLEALFSTGNRLAPTPVEIVRKLGATSPSYALDKTELNAIYQRSKKTPAVKVKRAMWANLLTTAAGTNFTDDDVLFVDHTFLVVIAEIIGHSVVGLRPEDPEISAGTIVSGALFSEAQINGVVEADFFDWIAQVPGGERFVKNLAQRIARFAWDKVEHDVLKVLYESIIPQEVRHQLGEYYTPDWLAEEIVDHCVSAPLADRILDASCGSGAFLFHAVRKYAAAAMEAGMSDSDIIRQVGEHVIGFDVHPVAVTLARVTYLLAIGMQRLRARDRPAFAIPVYLGDSLHWGQESTLWSNNGLSVPTALDHQTFLNDPDLLESTSGTPHLTFPDAIVAHADRFDRLVNELADLATDRPRKSATPSLYAIFKRFEIKEKVDQSVIWETFKSMCRLHDDERNHIWGYYVRNLARPVWLCRPENRVDVLIGNPPWLAYRYMTKMQKASFRSMSSERGLWSGASVATSQDLSGLFVARCIEQYLRVEGRFGYVMPLGVLSRQQYAGFRTGNFSTSSDVVGVGFDSPWDLHQIKPAFFPQSVGVVFGKRSKNSSGSTSLHKQAEIWSGKFATKTAGLTEARLCISRTIGEKFRASQESQYKNIFTQGAAVVPRFLFLIDESMVGPLGSGGNRQRVRSSRSSFEKPPWKTLPGLQGSVEREFIRSIYQGNTILPFRCLAPNKMIVPWDGQRLLDGSDERLDTYPGLAKWWRSAEKVWRTYGSNEGISLLNHFNYRNKISQQLPISRQRVVYNKSGAYLAAAIVTDDTAIIDQQLYWAAIEDRNEALFLTSILNSNTLTLMVRPLQARGEHNPRDFAKTIFQLPIPLYNPKKPDHLRLVDLAKRAELVARDTPLVSIRFEALRRRVREALIRDGVADQIDEIVKKLLA
ncbi:S1 family peptidase [Amycolatopsis circi]|uniref:S1 family peptidase n=1 Tax=Amycolatopsis circi TaxID=871959 RepID=UPI0013BE91FC|nr:serine protease [Amycolatopsis circi]